MFEALRVTKENLLETFDDFNRISMEEHERTTKKKLLVVGRGRGVKKFNGNE